jgi:hypothetical protein
VKSIEMRRRTKVALTGVSVSTLRWRQRWPFARSTSSASTSGCALASKVSSNHIAGEGWRPSPPEAICDPGHTNRIGQSVLIR